MGAHHPRHASDAEVRTPRGAWLVIAPVALLTLAALVWLWPSGSTGDVAGPSPAAQQAGTIVSVQRQECEEQLPDEVNGCGTALVELEGADGVTRDEEVPLPNGTGAPEVAEGDSVFLIETEGPDGTTFTIVDHQRGTGLVVLVGAFVLALVAFGRWRGVSAIAGLGVTFALLLFFVLPAILAGEPPLLVAIVGSCATMLTVLYLTHGLGLSTTVAVLGTVASLTLTGVLSAVAVSALHLTGVTDDLSASVGMSQGVNTQGLLLAGIVIGSLGVLDDVTVTQAATVSEVARANPAYGFAQLYRAGSRVGRAHIASVVNTIVLAYAGSSLPLLILIVANDHALGSVVTDQVIAQEIVRSVVATLGLVAAVPLTTALAALTALRRRDGWSHDEQQDHDHDEHEREDGDGASVHDGSLPTGRLGVAGSASTLAAHGRCTPHPHGSPRRNGQRVFLDWFKTRWKARDVPTAEDLQGMLRSAALRVTRPRLAVLEAVHALPHADTDTIIAASRERLGEVSHQAVYDVLRALTSAGLVRRIQPSGSVARYEARVADNHHHVVCRGCGVIADVDCAVGHTPCLTAADDHGFRIDEAEVVYWGTCPACAAPHA